LNFELAAAAKNLGIELSKDGPVPNRLRFGRSNGRRNLKAFNKGKLLLSYFKGLSPRHLEMLAIPVDDSSVVTPSSSQLQHRDAFFRAVRDGDQRAAAKMLGRLREEEHDPGELAFLEATESFHSKHYLEAIEHARNVLTSAID